MELEQISHNLMRDPETGEEYEEDITELPQGFIRLCYHVGHHVPLMHVELQDPWLGPRPRDMSTRILTGSRNQAESSFLTGTKRHREHPLVAFLRPGDFEKVFERVKSRWIEILLAIRTPRALPCAPMTDIILT